MSNKPNIFKIHKDGYLFICIFAIVTAIFSVTWEPLGWIGFILTLWCVYFFRDPDRVVPIGNYITSPADGLISKISTTSLPQELNIGDQKVVCISIFLNIFDTHVNRVPADGEIKKLLYHPGKFFNASLDKASIHNERNHVVMKLKNNNIIVFTQIAGLIARRIVCSLEEKQKVAAGERYGIIRFGSRVDVYLPAGEKPLVLVGQRVRAGETILAELGSSLDLKGQIK